MLKKWVICQNYRWLFLRKEQKWHPKSTFHLKSLVSPIKTVTFLSLVWCDTLFLNWKSYDIFCSSWILLNKLRTSNFEMWSWDVIFVPFSEKVIYVFWKDRNWHNPYFHLWFLLNKKSYEFNHKGLKTALSWVQMLRVKFYSSILKISWRLCPFAQP